MKKRILVIRFSSLGDVILTSAPVLNLKISFPDSHIVYLTKESYQNLVESFDGVDETVTIPDKVSLFDYFKVLQRLDNYNFDIIIDWHGSPRSWLARKTITATKRLVYPKRRLERMMLVKQKRIPSKWPHTIDLYNDCIRQLGGTTAASRPIIKSPNIIDNDSLFKKGGDASYIVIAPGAAHPNKQWPVERFVETALVLNREHRVKIVWAVTGADRDKFPQELIADDDFVELVDCPIVKLAGYIAGARLTIANDSGIAHLSSAVGTPAVAVFGPTHPALGFSPCGIYDRLIEVDEFCRPCSLHGKKPCYREERYCLTKIIPETVIEAAEDTLNMVTNKNRAVFLDRDGTIIVDKHFLSNPDEIEFENGAVEALKILKKLGFKIFIISNQSGVARGYFDMDSVEKVNERVLELIANAGVKIDGIYYCPHHKKGSNPTYTRECNCRKPAPGMVERAAHRFNIDLRNSYVIGDKKNDYDLGRVIGGRSFMVQTGYGNDNANCLIASGDIDKDNVFDSLLDVARYLKDIEGV